MWAHIVLTSVAASPPCGRISSQTYRPAGYRRAYRPNVGVDRVGDPLARGQMAAFLTRAIDG